MIEIPDNACVNSSIFCATDTGTASVRYFGKDRAPGNPTYRDRETDTDRQADRYRETYLEIERDRLSPMGFLVDAGNLPPQRRGEGEAPANRGRRHRGVGRAE